MSDSPVCVSCGARILFGEPERSTLNGKPQLWCTECFEDYCNASWPEDVYGPRQGLNIVRASERAN